MNRGILATCTAPSGDPNLSTEDAYAAYAAAYADEPFVHLLPEGRWPTTAQVLGALRRVVRALRLAAAGAEAEGGVSAAQLFVLEQVAAAPGQWLTALAARTLTLYTLDLEKLAQFAASVNVPMLQLQTAHIRRFVAQMHSGGRSGRGSLASRRLG